MITLRSQGTHTHPFGVYFGSLAAFVADVCVDMVGPTLILILRTCLEQTIHSYTIVFMQLLTCEVLFTSEANFISMEFVSLLYSQF